MSLRNRIFLVFVLAAALSVGGLVYWMSSDMRPRYMEAQEDLMVDLGHILADLIAANALREDAAGPDPDKLQRAFGGLGERDFSAQIYSLLKTRVDVRVYVTDARGVVLFDSEADRDLGRDNSQWRDIKLSLAGDYGARSTEGDPMFPAGATMYVSTPIRRPADGEILGVVSVGKPTRNAERFRLSAMSRFSQAALFALVLALALALILYWWLSRPLQRLADYARDLRLGRRVAPPRLGRNEIGRVGQAMTELRDALDGKNYVEAYVQSLTHELKSPTAAIAGAAELLAEQPPEPDRARFLRNIRVEAQRLQRLIERMLQLAGIENRAALEQAQTLEVVDLIEESLEALGPLLAQKNLRSECVIDPELKVNGERFLLVQAIGNLLTNAVEFSSPGGLIGVRAQTEGGTVRIRIRDEGPGIPEFARARVFERFYCLAHPDGSKGTGLGLSFVAQIAALHGGSARLDNAPSGAVAELSLPAVS